MNFADTNWLTALYLEADPRDKVAVQRRSVVERFMRQHGGQVALSHIVLLEARNVFSRVTGERSPLEWADLEADFDGKLYVDPMNWHLLRRECDDIFSRHAWQTALGTFDVALVASAKLAGAKTFLTFDVQLAALASVEGLNVFPALDDAGKTLAHRLKHPSGK
jgi:predicted nucleic acid-binding protein